MNAATNTITEESFELNLGPKQSSINPLRHRKDYTCEVLVDFADGREGSLGFLSVIHNPLSGKLEFWALVDGNGDNLPGQASLYPSKNAAMSTARSFLQDYLAKG